MCFALGYELERKDNPGIIVDPNSTLESQRTLDFVLVKNQGRLLGLGKNRSFQC